MKQILKYIYDFKINTYWGIPDKFDERYYHLLLSDIQKWFRDNHNIVVTCYEFLVETSNKQGYRFSWTMIDWENGEPSSIVDKTTLGYLTYNESLEAGILKAFQKLSLIELTNMENNEYI